MRRKDAIALCRYYKGEESNPYTKNKGILWFYEQSWVYMMSQDQSLQECISDYIAYGLTKFHDDDGVPLSLKAVLFNRFAKSCYSMQSAVEPFMEFYKQYYF